jgi:hypothetical protein
LRFLALGLLGDPDQERARHCGEALGAPSYSDWVRRTVERLLSLRPRTALADLPEIHRYAGSAASAEAGERERCRRQQSVTKMGVASKQRDLLWV